MQQHDRKEQDKRRTLDRRQARAFKLAGRIGEKIARHVQATQQGGDVFRDYATRRAARGG